MLLLSIEHAQTIRTSKAQKNARTKSRVDSLDRAQGIETGFGVTMLHTISFSVYSMLL